MPYSLYNALDKYNFSNLAQKNALEILLKRAAIIDFNQTISDKFPARDNFNEFVNDVLEFVKITQKRIFLRSAGQERWEVSPLGWMQENQASTISMLEILDMKRAIKPSLKEIDLLCILGATSSTMKKRIAFSEQLLAQGYTFKKIALISGERYVNLQVDGPETELQKIRQEQNLQSVSNLTEAHLIDYFFRNSQLSHIAYHLINTPKNNLSRPTTQTTVIDLANWLRTENNTENLVFVSGQPTIKYQEAVINQVLRFVNVTKNIEVVGYEDSEDNTQKLLEGLGSFIFAQTPNVLVSFNETITDSGVIDEFYKVFGSQPLIYQEAVNTNLIIGSEPDIAIVPG